MTVSDLSARAGQTGLVTRSRSFDGAELRSTDGGNSLTFTGYASVFNRSYTVTDWLGEFNEVVAPGAFRDSLAKGADVPFKLNHDGMTLARTKSGTMQLAEDSHGLHVEARLDPSNPQVQAIRSAMERGDLDEMSFAFRTTADTWDESYMNRTITGADINKGDVSVVNYGANPFTTGAKLRSADIARALRSVEPDELDPEAKTALAALLGIAVPDLGESEVSESVSADEFNELTDFYAHRLRALSL
jgi:HK97 family phage prohead protease